MFSELGSVVLTTSVPDHGLEPGDVGAVVHAYAENQAYEVEFADGSGSNIATVTLEAAAVRPVSAGEILHVRDMRG